MKNNVLIKDEAVAMQWFDLLQKRASCCGKLLLPDGTASGLRITSHLMVTCAHVLRSEGEARQTIFTLDGLGVGENLVEKSFSLNPSACYIRNTQLDYCLVALDTNAKESSMEVLPIAIPQKWAHIIHYPKGGEKKVSFRNNCIKKRKEIAVYYTSYTAAGSSGAPVFDDHWNWIAMHVGCVSSRQSKISLNKGIRADKIIEDIEKHFPEIKNQP